MLGPDNGLSCPHLDPVMHLWSAAGYSGPWLGEWGQVGHVSWLTSSMLFQACPQCLVIPWPWVFWEPPSAKSWMPLAGMRRRGGGKREWEPEAGKWGWTPKKESVGTGAMGWFAVYTTPSRTLFELPSGLGGKCYLLYQFFRWGNCYSKCSSGFNKIT